MSLQRQAVFWLGALLAFGLAIYAVQRHPAALRGGAGARLFPRSAGRPAGAARHAAGSGRRWSSSACSSSSSWWRCWCSLPLLASIADFLTQVPGYARKLQQLHRPARPAHASSASAAAFEPPDLSGLDRRFHRARASAWSATFAEVAVDGQPDTPRRAVSLLVVTPVVAFYLLVDWDRMIAKVDSWVPPRHRDGPRAGPRDQRRDRRLHPGPGAGLPAAGHLVRGRPVADAG